MWMRAVNSWLKILKKSNFYFVEKAIDYQFSDASHLELALSHRSVGKKNNERLEFLGDAMLGLVISEALFLKFPKLKEGELSRLRSLLVRGDTLAELAREMKLDEYILLGGGELKSGGHRRASIQADVVEAIIGAIFLDSGFDQCKRTVLTWFENRLSALNTNFVSKDAKTLLQEYMQETGKPLPVYRVVEEMGESHARQYKVECEIDSEGQTFHGMATSKRAAEKAAAAEALNFLGRPLNDR